MIGERLVLDADRWGAGFMVVGGRGRGRRLRGGLGPAGARIARWSACPVVVAGRGHPGTGHRASQPQEEPGSRRFRC